MGKWTGEMAQWMEANIVDHLANVVEDDLFVLETYSTSPK